MLRLPQSRGRGPRSSHQQRIAFAVALLLIPWIQITTAESLQNHPPSLENRSPVGAAEPNNDYARARVDGSLETPHDVGSTDGVIDIPSAENIARDVHHPSDNQASTFTPKHQQHAAKGKQPQGDTGHPGLHNEQLKRPTTRKNEKDRQIYPHDASALATLAPAQPVRAPHPPRQHKPNGAASGLASPHVARSLEDWEVEDFILLATVDGDLYATNRKTGTEIWRLEVDQPMIETKHHRANSSILDEDYNPIDHYVWAVEPNRDGGIYVWIPDSNVGLVRTSFTMKRIVEELSPYAGEDFPVVYTGDKKTTLITLDAATGRVLKWFGSSGSHINEAESCLRPDTLYNMDSTECSSTGTITMGRTEYTVSIQRKDGFPIATLKYAEWGPNNFDNDLYHQYHASLDNRYVTSQHDGKVYAFDYTHAQSSLPKFRQKFSAPVARVFDVCRPWDAPTDSNPELVVLPQPPMPSQDEEIARTRSNSIFLNHTESGSWYAMSGRAYPLIIDAPAAKLAQSNWLELAPPIDSIGMDGISKALVGTHLLDSPRGTGERRQTLPAGPDHGHEKLPEDPYLPVPAPETTDNGIIGKVKALPQSAVNSIIDFVSNPTLIIVFVVMLIYNENKLRRWYQRFRAKDFLQKMSALKFNELDALIDDDADRRVDEHIVQDEHRDQADRNGVPQQAADPDAAVARVDHATEVGAGEDGQPAAAQNVEPQSEAPNVEATPNGAPPDKKKKAHRGRRGGVKHRKGKPRDPSQSQGEEAIVKPLDEAVSTAMKLGGEQRTVGVEPNVMTVQPNDMQAVGEPIIRMGNIEVNTEEQLGSGSNGTLVFAGKFDGRDVAVKRMLIHFYDIASQETRLLRESDDHPNVIRYYSQQIQDGFLYIALERCAASLAEIVEKPHVFRDLANAGKQDLPAVLYQITNGISHLHNLRIVHRDLKPQNILVNMTKNGKPRMLVSDFGLCKKLEDTQSSFGATTGRAAGTSGWRAPELLLDDDGNYPRDPDTHSGSGSVLVHDGMNPSNRRATRAIDIFSLGLVFFYVLTNGLHPFDCGDRYMREVNIRNGQFSLGPLNALGDFAYEAKDLIASMLQRHPKDRPSAVEVMSHPFFWSPKKRLAFLCDVSDHFEKEIRDPPSPALQELERHAPQVTSGDFLRSLPRDFIESMGKQRKYTGSRLLDLLRALRNKRNHYEDMSDSLKRSVGPLPDGYLSFWTVRFPMLLLVCWNVVYEVRWEESDRFREYYQPAGL